MPEPKFFRCMTCDRLIGPKMIAAGECGGHRVKYAFRCSLWEWILMKLRVIR